MLTVQPLLYLLIVPFHSFVSLHPQKIFISVLPFLVCLCAIGFLDKYLAEPERGVNLNEVNYIIIYSLKECPLLAMNSINSISQCNAILNQGDVVMERRTRINYMPKKKRLCGTKYKGGDSQHEIVREFGRYLSFIMLTNYQTG